MQDLDWLFNPQQGLCDFIQSSPGIRENHSTNLRLIVLIHSTFIRERQFFPPEEKKKCYLVTCYPPVFSMRHFSFQTEQSIHALPFPIRIDHTRSAHPLKALKGRADSAWPLPSSLFFSLSKDYIGRIYTYIYRAHDMLKVR